MQAARINNNKRALYTKVPFFYGWIIIAVLIITGFLMMGINSSFGVFFNSLVDEFNMTRATTSSILSVRMLFSMGAFIVGLFANFGVLLQGLYLSGDMEFLLTAPLPARAVFLSKLIQAILPNLLLLGLISTPAMVGLVSFPPTSACHFSRRAVGTADRM